MYLHWLAPRFSEPVRPEERAELVNDFAVAMDAVVAAMDVEEIIRGDG